MLIKYSNNLMPARHSSIEWDSQIIRLSLVQDPSLIAKLPHGMVITLGDISYF